MDIMAASSSEPKPESEIRSASAVAHGENPEEMVQIAEALLDLNPRPAWLADLLVSQDFVSELWDGNIVKRCCDTVQKNVNVGGLECATGVLLALLALSCPIVDLRVDRSEGNEIVAEAFFKALASSRSALVELTLSGRWFVTARAGAHLGHCLNTNSTLQQLNVYLLSRRVEVGFVKPGKGKVDDEWDMWQWWTALSNSLNESANSTLQILYIEEPSIIGRRPSFFGRRTGIDDSYPAPIGAHLAAIQGALLNKFAALENLSLYLRPDRNEQEVRKLLSPVLTNPASTLIKLILKYYPGDDDEEHLQHLIPVTAEALLRNTSIKLETLCIFGEYRHRDKGVHLSSGVCKEVAQILLSNTTLKSLWYPRSVQFMGSDIVDAMSRNHSLGLEVLDMRLDGAGATALFRLLTPTSKLAMGPPPTHSTATVTAALSHLRELTIPCCSGDAKALARMLALNTTLVKLDLNRAAYSRRKWVAILPQLASNTILRTLCLDYCDGVDEDAVYKVLTYLLLANTTIEHMQVDGTPLARAGKREALGETIKRNVEYRASLVGLPKVRSKSGRLVMCGYPLAGKSTLVDTMLRSIKEQQLATSQQPGETSNPNDHNCGGEGEGERERERDRDRPRTRGIEVVLLVDEEDLRISVWDFAGQPEYYALHDCVFPDTNGSTVFLFAHKPLDGATMANKLNHLRQQLEYWLRFISSNSRPEHAIKPMVLVVITHQDQEAVRLKDMDVQRTVKHLARTFVNLNLHVETDRIFLLNATAPDEVKKLFHVIETEFKQLLSFLEEVPTICELTLSAVREWAKDAGENPIMPVDQFERLVQGACKTELLKIDTSETISKAIMRQTSWKVVAAYLRDSGAIIFFEDLEFIVIDPHWFGHAIFGYLMNPFSYDGEDEVQDFNPTNGIVCAAELDQLFEKSLARIKASKDIVASTISTPMLILLMKKFNLCYDHTEEGNEKQYLVPILMGGANHPSTKGERKLEWSKKPTSDSHVYVGFRMQCVDTDRTFLTPGFFPRLQIILYDLCISEGWVSREHLWQTSLLNVNMFHILIDGIGHEILIEYSGQVGYFIDILVRSGRSYSEAVKFVQKNLITKIRAFCASQQGCIGVSLVEGLIRKDCVTSLTLCKYRTEHTSVLISKLRSEIPKCLENIYIHNWQAIKGSDPPLGHTSGYAILISEDIVLLDDDQQNVRDARAGHPPIPAIEHVSNSDIPLGPVYLSHNVGLWRKFVSGLYYGRVIPLRLHVECECGGNASHEHAGSTHKVASQRGRMFYLMDKDAMRVQPWASWIYCCLSLAANVGLQLVPVPAIGAVGSAVTNVPLTRTAYCERPIEDLLLPGEDPASMSDDTLRSKLEEFLGRNPKYGWKTTFLAQSNKEKHFGLRKAIVRGQPNSRDIWICDDCMEQDKVEQKYEHC